MPDPVMGAILVYVACYMILAGIQVITSRMLDARRIFVVGIALIFGLSVDMVPGLYRDVPNQIQPLFSSSLSHLHGSRRGSEPAFSDRHYQAPVSGVDARCRRFAENF